MSWMSRQGATLFIRRKGMVKVAGKCHFFYKVPFFCEIMRNFGVSNLCGRWPMVCPRIMKKYLVTGGAGFIGANFVKYLLEAYGGDVEVVVLDKLTYAGHVESLSAELDRENVRLVVGDVNDGPLVEGIMEDFDPDYVVNFAAESHVDRSIDGPRPFLETNIMGAQTLLEAARCCWQLPEGGFRQGKRFLQISTDEVYGSLTRDSGEPRKLHLDGPLETVVAGRHGLKAFGPGFFTEETPLHPHSPYSASKASADMMASAYFDTYGMPVCVTRCSNNYGPYQFPEKLIPLAIRHIIKGEKIPVYARGENVRDWLFVADHCRAIDLVLREGEDGQAYNIGGFNEQQNIDVVRLLIDTVRRLAESEPRYRHMLSIGPEKVDYSLIEFVADRPGHDMRYAIDPSKIAGRLGWYPATSFEDGIEATVRWCLDNADWAEAVTEGTGGYL